MDNTIKEVKDELQIEVRNTHISDKINDLFAETDFLDKVTQNLYERISNILIEEKTDESENEIEEKVSPAANSLNVICRRMRAISDKINKIIREVDL